MSLAPSRQVFATNIKYALNEVAERGVVACIVAGTTANGEVTTSAVPTGVGVQPIGMLLDDVEDMNFDRHGEYRQRNVVDVGSVVGLAAKADLETDRITGSPVAGDDMFLGPNGTVSPTQLTDGITSAPRLGYFQSAPNANGFAAIHLDL